MDMLAPIAHVGNQSPDPEVYAEFYAQLSPEALASRELETVLSRVLHTDETDDRSRHIMLLRQRFDRSPPIIRRLNDIGAPEHLVPYREDAFELFMTDGLRISTYDILSVHGLYRACLNGIDRQYDARNETIFVRCRQEGQHTSTLSFNCKTGDGVMNPYTEPTGWILSEQESLSVKNTVLAAAAGSLARVLRAS